MAELTKDNIEAELERDLAELEKKGPKKSTKKKSTKTAKEPAKKVKKETPKKKAATSEKKTTKPAKDKPAKKPASTVKKEASAAEKPAIKKPVNAKKEPSKEPAKKKTEEKQTEDDERSTRIFYGGIAAIIILFAALLIGGKYIPSAGADDTLAYNGYTFVKGPTHWTFEWQNDNTIYTVPLRFNPEEVEDVHVEGVLDPRFNKLRPIYITFDPTSPQSNFTLLTLGTSELTFSLAQALRQEVAPACAAQDEEGVCAERDIVNCENSEGKAVIYLKTQEPAGIFIQDTCIVIQGDDLDLVRSIDRLLYDWYGVIR